MSASLTTGTGSRAVQPGELLEAWMYGEVFHQNPSEKQLLQLLRQHPLFQFNLQSTVMLLCGRVLDLDDIIADFLGEERVPRITAGATASEASGTGRRISAILALRWNDIVWDARPNGAIRWRADADKMGREWTAPIAPEVRSCLDRLRRERPGVGGAPLFPSPVNPAEPVSYERVRCWLNKAEELANLPKQVGGSFHPYRRAWATARKHLPITDVAAAGGWKSEAVLLRHYQQPDQATLLVVVTGGRELRENQV